MPTKKKRVGFIPREDVMKIIDKLSLENNLSNSKITSILVEEALSIRGIFNIKTGKAVQSLKHINDDKKKLSEDHTDFKEHEKFTINPKIGNHGNPYKTNLLKQANQEELDFRTYKKFISFLKFQEMIDDFNN